MEVRDVGERRRPAGGGQGRHRGVGRARAGARIGRSRSEANSGSASRRCSVLASSIVCSAQLPRFQRSGSLTISRPATREALGRVAYLGAGPRRSRRRGPRDSVRHQRSASRRRAGRPSGRQRHRCCRPRSACRTPLRTSRVDPCRRGHARAGSEAPHCGHEALGGVGLVGVRLEVRVELDADRVAERAGRRRGPMVGRGRGAGAGERPSRAGNTMDAIARLRSARRVGLDIEVATPRRGAAGTFRSVMDTTMRLNTPSFGVLF